MVNFAKGLDTRNQFLVDELFKRAVKIACEEMQYTEAFAVLWMSFNGWGSLVTECETDQEMIDELAADQRLEKEFADYFRTDAEYRKIVTEFAVTWPLFSNRDIKLRGLSPRMEAWYKDDATIQELMKYPNSSAKKGGKGGIRRSPKNDKFKQDAPSWKDTLDALYMVRNNLVHGSKGVDSGDAEIIKCAYKTLSGFISAKKICSWK